ncbi:MAG: bifunctional (p)ppGpp synthetase/guanosine-3',5'-bis(diphosphate) 3'-pyrophosphohydrolase [Vallitaleaceae bacterium]|nr:bifunctional (p)ppGpp synthetase/guanosine-3',5'-bis(diphosphate) 3'-pyrophosphohydrolase [Vallitaleaceae bacterium]
MVKMPDKLYERLIEEIKKYHPSEDFELIEKAYALAKSAHIDQLRKSGEPYIVHPLEVANVLAQLELDKESIIAGILHDVIEDTEYSFDDIAKEFSEEVALLVEGVTKLNMLEYSNDKEDIQAENYRKMFIAMAKDIRVILIKLADRLHNMRTLKYMPEHKQKEIAKETLNLYAPLAHRLGISKVKTELEDLSLKYLHPEAFYDLVEKIDTKKDERENYVTAIREDLITQLDKVGIKAEVDGRPKHFFSNYKKMIAQQKTIDQIFDLFAVRVVVDSVKDCYGVLGVIHDMYKPIPGRFKDYIAMPKANNYQSLHTTLIGPEGKPFEMQIRTIEMHRTAEYGIAAHWKYKEGRTGKPNKENAEQKLSWLRQILEWQRDISDNKEFMEAVKTELDVFTDQVYAFTPTGDVIDLSTGSTPIDFAYHIHSAVGNKMVGARVNGRIVNFDYEIKNGDRIEILTSQNSNGPSRDWLKIVKSTQAKNKIQQWFRKQFKEENITRGKEMLDKYCKSKNITMSDIMKPEWIDIVQRKYGFKDWDSICASIGHGGLKEGQIINRLVDEYKKTQKVEDKDVLLIKEDTTDRSKYTKSKSGIVVEGLSDLAVRFSRCCSPVPGDEIIGFITRGRGISIHRTDCVNMINLNENDRERLIESEWQEVEETDKKQLYITEIQIIGSDRQGLLVDISKVLTDGGTPVKALNARSVGTDKAVFNVTIQINGVDQLSGLIKQLNNIKGVHEIIRPNS